MEKIGLWFSVRVENTPQRFQDCRFSGAVHMWDLPRLPHCSRCSDVSLKPANMQCNIRWKTKQKKSNKKFHIITPLCNNRSEKVPDDWLAIQNTISNDRKWLHEDRCAPVVNYIQSAWFRDVKLEIKELAQRFSNGRISTIKLAPYIKKSNKWIVAISV